MPPRFFRHGELPLVLLALVRQRPRHRYDLMAELTRLFGPRYRASPGSVYPAIDALEAEQLVAPDVVDGRTVYRLTSSGAQALADRSDALAALEVRVGVHLGEQDGLEAELTRFAARLAPLAGHLDPQVIAETLDRAAAELERQAQPSTTTTGRPSHAG